VKVAHAPCTVEAVELQQACRLPHGLNGQRADNAREDFLLRGTIKATAIIHHLDLSFIVSELTIHALGGTLLHYPVQPV
jgi:hypothetical protein